MSRYTSRYQNTWSHVSRHHKGFLSFPGRRRTELGVKYTCAKFSARLVESIYNQVKTQQVFVFLTELIEEEIRRIEIHRVTEEGKQGIGGSVGKTVDREFGTEEKNCYVATTRSSWLSFEFTWSSVTHVDILVTNTAGRKSFRSGRLQTSFVNEIFFQNRGVGFLFDCKSTEKI